MPEMDDIISLAPSVREVSELLGENESSVQEGSNTQHDSDHSKTFLDSNNNAALLRHAIRRRGLIFTGNCICDVT